MLERARERQSRLDAGVTAAATAPAALAPLNSDGSSSDLSDAVQPGECPAPRELLKEVLSETYHLYGKRPRQ